MKAYCICGHEMMPTGIRYLSDPPLYEYECKHCGAVIANRVPYNDLKEEDAKNDQLAPDNSKARP